MTIPGNVTALLVLVAVLVACTGYIAGRLHQWYRTDEDRDEAYREGYDTATRSTFSMAARIIGPRRERSTVRGSATVHASVARPGPAAPTEARSAAEPARRDTGALPAGPAAGSAPAAPVTGSAPAAPVTGSAPAAPLTGSAPAGSAADFAAPTPMSASASSPSRGSFARSLSRAIARSRRFHSIFPSSSFPLASSNTSAARIASRPPSSTPSPDVSRSPIGPSSAVTPPLASGSWAADAPRSPITGLTPAASSPPAASSAASSSGAPSPPAASSLPGASLSPAASLSPGGLSPEHQRATGDTTPTGSEPAAEAGKRSRPGRHFVPDELVRAETYRLAPDRVARAKVPNSDVAPPAADGDPARPPTVPRPRSS